MSRVRDGPGRGWGLSFMEASAKLLPSTIFQGLGKVIVVDGWMDEWLVRRCSISRFAHGYGLADRLMAPYPSHPRPIHGLTASCPPSPIIVMRSLVRREDDGPRF